MFLKYITRNKEWVRLGEEKLKASYHVIVVHYYGNNGCILNTCGTYQLKEGNSSQRTDSFI